MLAEVTWRPTRGQGLECSVKDEPLRKWTPSLLWLDTQFVPTGSAQPQSVKIFLVLEAHSCHFLAVKSLSKVLCYYLHQMAQIILPKYRIMSNVE